MTEETANILVTMRIVKRFRAYLETKTQQCIKRPSCVFCLGLCVLPPNAIAPTAIIKHGLGFVSHITGLTMEEMEAIRWSIFEKVQRRFAEDAEQDSIGKGITTGNTERYDRVFALWVNLQKAMQFRWNNEAREDVQTPWDCEDLRVRNAWTALTNPRNELALEILSHQLPEGPQLEKVRKALQVCRERSKGGSPK